MASPQCENGYTKIANELLEAMAIHRMAGQEYQILFAIMRKTYGFGKKQDNISLNQLSEMTGLDRRRIHALIQKMVIRNIITVTNNGDRSPKSISINKDYESWKSVTKIGDRSPVTNNGDRTVTNNGDKSVTNNGDYKRKERKKEIPSCFFDISKRFHDYQKKQLGKQLRVTEKTITDGAGELEKLCRLDGFDLEKEIRPTLQWAVQDDFWKDNIRSLGGIRKLGKNGQPKFMNMFTAFKKANPTKKITLVY